MVQSGINCNVDDNVGYRNATIRSGPIQILKIQNYMLNTNVGLYVLISIKTCNALFKYPAV